MVTPLILQTIFAGLVAAIIVNIRWSKEGWRWLVEFLGWLFGAAGIVAQRSSRRRSNFRSRT
jgi:hypothetical protein